MQVIGLMGRAGAGKDTCAEYLFDPKTDVRLAFAGPMKHDLSNILNLPEKMFHERSLKERPLLSYPKDTPRTLMTWYGTLMKERFGNDFWIKRMRESIEAHNHCKRILITDVRFPDEVAFVRSYTNHTLIYVDRPSLGALSPDAHISERSAYNLKSNAHIVLINDGTLDDLHQKIYTHFKS